jgi:hypothetical protein
MYLRATFVHSANINSDTYSPLSLLIFICPVLVVPKITSVRAEGLRQQIIFLHKALRTREQPRV